MVSVKDAIKAAKEYVIDLYSEDKIKDVLLEEVQRDGLDWLITIGFRDPSDGHYEPVAPVVVDEDGTAIWDQEVARVPPPAGFIRWPRLYKVVRVDGNSGKPVSITIRAA